MSLVPRTKPQEVTLNLIRRVRETADTSTLVFERPTDLPPYQAGQFLTLDPKQFAAVRPWLTFLEHAKGRKELVRAYSMSSAPFEPELAVTIKEEAYEPTVHPYPPLISGYLVHGIAPGTAVKAVCFTGPYVLPADIEQKTDQIVHIVAGSGAIPNFSILKESLRAHPKLRHLFLYSNKTWADICFREALAALEQEHPAQLRVVHTLTREPDATRLGPNVRAGRISLPLLQELVPDPQQPFFYVCGPAITNHQRRIALASGGRAEPRFLEQVVDFLEQLGAPKTKVKREAYG
jgi:ferredoxin-NADP reductase